jgi:hypothetical protein
MDRKTALESVGFTYKNGRYQKLICENDGVSYTLTTEPNGVIYKVDKKLSDGSEQTDGAGKYVDSPLGVEIKKIVDAVNENMGRKKVPAENEMVEIEEPNGFKEGGYQKFKEEPIQEAVYVDVGDQKKVKLPKPGRRIRNSQPELMEVGTIRAGEKIQKNGKVLPSKTSYFIITTKKRKNADNKDDPDLGYEIDEEIHKIVGEKPTKLKVRLPCNREDLNLVTYYGKYKSAVCECRGDGYTAEKSSGEIILCNGLNCESYIKGECKRHGVLSVILEDAPRCGVIWKFRTTSRSSLSYLEASLDSLTGLANGHVASLPLWLTLTPKETTIPDGPYKGKKTTVYVANLEFRGGYVELDKTVQKLVAGSNGRDPIQAIERVMESTLSLPDSPEDVRDIQETFHPEVEA